MMKKDLFNRRKVMFALALGISGIVHTQVGINNTNPKATLDIVAGTVDGSRPEGLIIPRLTGDQIRMADSKYGADQTGTMIYATAADSIPGGKTVNIITAGYYYFDGIIWRKIGSGGSGVNDWFSEGGTTDAVGDKISTIYRTGSVGLGSSQTISPYAKFQVTSTNQGIMIPSVNLTSSSMDLNPDGDNNISNQPIGLFVFNTGDTLNRGLYYWDGNAWILPGVTAGEVDFSDCSSIKVNGVYSSEKLLTDQSVNISVPVKVNKIGSYNYEATVNGITFAAQGTFATLGTQVVVLVPVAGTPSNMVSGSYPATIKIAPIQDANSPVVCSNISVSFMARSGAKMKIIYFTNATFRTVLTPGTSSASTRTGQWLTGVTMADPSGIAPSHTALYYSGTAEINLVGITSSSDPSVLKDLLDTASVVFIGGEVSLSNAQAGLIQQWLKAGKGYFITMNDTADYNKVGENLGYYLENGADVSCTLQNVANYPQIFSQTSPYEAPFALGSGIDIGRQGTAAATVTSNNGSAFITSISNSKVRSMGYIDLAGNSFIIGDKFGYANTAVDQNFQRLLIDIFAFVLKNAPIYTTN